MIRSRIKRLCARWRRFSAAFRSTLRSEVMANTALFFGTFGALRIKPLPHFFSFFFHTLCEAVGWNMIRLKRYLRSPSVKEKIEHIVERRSTTACMATKLFPKVLDNLSLFPRCIFFRCRQALHSKGTCTSQTIHRLETPRNGGS